MRPAKAIVARAHVKKKSGIAYCGESRDSGKGRSTPSPTKRFAKSGNANLSARKTDATIVMMIKNDLRVLSMDGERLLHRPAGGA
jgi:hypothetical protein